jgi:hypothetical protein
MREMPWNWINIWDVPVNADEHVGCLKVCNIARTAPCAPRYASPFLETIDEKGACGISLSPIARAENRRRIYVSFADVASLDGDVQ